MRVLPEDPPSTGEHHFSENAVRWRLPISNTYFNHGISYLGEQKISRIIHISKHFANEQWKIIVPIEPTIHSSMDYKL